MAELGRARIRLAAATAERSKLIASLNEQVAQISSARGYLGEIQVSGAPGDRDAAAARVDELVEQRAAAARAISELDERVRLELGGLLGNTLRLDADLPLALLPVRVETRSTEDGARLRVRIYHDTLHSESLDEGLSDVEREAGITYWTAVWPDPAATSAAWQTLLAATGRRRATWVAEALRPRNLARRPADPPDFPATPPRTARPPAARTLPDRFYVRIEQDGAAPVTVAGNAIPDEVPTGLTDRDELSALRIEGRDLPPIDESLRWLVDYDEAVRIGMAVTVTLPRPGVTVRRLLVFGVRAALDGAASAQRLEQLLRSHQFTDGAEFVAQGTPTNNTESARSGWSKSTPPAPPDTDISAAAPGSNAAVTAAALGVSPSSTMSLAGADGREQAHAAAFNTALWATTWGEAIEHLTPAGRANGDRRLDSAALDAVRDHWIHHVRGRGPLPVLRLGKQPYGLLPVVRTDEAWQPLRGGFVENRLVPFIDQQVRRIWEDGLGDVATVMNQPLDDALPRILGTDAVLRGLRVRTALSPDPIVRGAMALTLPDLGDTRSGREITKTLLLLAGVADNALDDNDLLGAMTRSLALPLAHDSDPAFVEALLRGEPPGGPKSVLQVLLAHAAAVEQHARDSVLPAGRAGLLHEIIGESRTDFDRDLVGAAVDSLLEGRGWDDPMVSAAAVHIEERVGRLDPRTIADRNPIPALAPRSTVQRVAGRQVRLELLTGAAGLQVIGELLLRTGWGARFRSALETIAGIDSLDERRLLLAETLDCCSHRLDAWISAAAARRLADVRSSRPRGAYIGAYGWLENIEIRVPADAGTVDGLDVLQDGADGGYVHAPSLTHAATAAVLRSGRLTHRRGDPNTDALDIDLSSNRTRDALSLLEGIRNGQSLGALLGYRLERRLHERSGGELELDRFIYVLRTLAPLRSGKLTEPGAPVQEGLAASDVVDGLRLMAIDPQLIAQKLEEGPTDNRYIDQWVPPLADESKAVLAAIAELEHTHDAVADLLLAESVHQLVSGNPTRAAAVLDVLGAGESVPPDPDVVRTPRTGVPIQHRIAIVVPDPLPSRVPGWSPMSPRAAAEPRLEAWAQRALPDPSAIPIVPDRALNVAYSGLSALDMLYDSDGDNVGASTLVRRLRVRFPDLGDDFSALAPYWELASMLRALLTGGRALDVADLGRPLAAADVGRAPDTAELLARARQATDQLKAAATGVDPEPMLLRFGVRAPVGAGAADGGEQAATRHALVEEAEQRAAAAAALLARVTVDMPAKSVVELATEALRVVFGGEFRAIPLLFAPRAGETDLWSGAVGTTAVNPRPGADLRPWLERAGRMRAHTGTFGETLLVREAFGMHPRLRAVQSPAGAYGSWVGLPFPEGRPPMVPLTNTVVEVAGPPGADLSGAVAGVVLDEWTEVLPRRLERRDPTDPDAAPELVDVTTTAIALNANAPGSRPPQAILLALSADGSDWDADKLVAVLDETMALARMRLLTLQQLPYAGRYLPALYFRDWSLQGEPVIEWAKVATEFDTRSVLDYLEAEQ
ncbi:hypothetical protein [Nocardia sp. NPDC019304]|uniref:hypothetical protein n=1 Tax=unclassified Nocardia TaxID=2637762 RepID=UPI0033ED50F6